MNLESRPGKTAARLAIRGVQTAQAAGQIMIVGAGVGQFAELSKGSDSALNNLSVLAMISIINYAIFMAEQRRADKLK